MLKLQLIHEKERGLQYVLEVAQEFLNRKILFFVTSRRILFRVSNEDRKFINFCFAAITNFLSSWANFKYLYRLSFHVVFSHVGKYDGAEDRPKPIIAGLYWLVILAPKSLPMIGRESLPELRRWPFKFITILIMTIKFKT